VKIDGVYVPGEGYCKVASGTEITKFVVLLAREQEQNFVTRYVNPYYSVVGLKIGKRRAGRQC